MSGKKRYGRFHIIARVHIVPNCKHSARHPGPELSVMCAGWMQFSNQGAFFFTSSFILNIFGCFVSIKLTFQSVARLIHFFSGNCLHHNTYFEVENAILIFIFYDILVLVYFIHDFLSNYFDVIIKRTQII